MPLHRLLFTIALMLSASLLNAAPAASPTLSPSPQGDTPLGELLASSPNSISGNPAAVTAYPGVNTFGQLTGLDDHGINLGGVWLGDTNGLISGGAQPGMWTWTSLLILNLSVDAEKLIGWEGGSFGIQFLQFDGQNTNGQAGSVQGYNSLVGPPPLDRSELYQLWVRQTFFDDRLIVRLGKLVPTLDFGNVARPINTRDEHLRIPAVTGLLFTPIFVNPTMLGATPGYYNSAGGVTVTIAPTDNLYLNYGFYDGNVALGVNTGMTGMHFNGYYFNIWELGTSWVLKDKYPGCFGVGYWYQTGLLKGPNGAAQDGTAGFYLFGSQRIWSHIAETGTIGRKTGDGKTDGKSVIASGNDHDKSISMYYQFGVNDSSTLPVNQYFGSGLTGFGLVPYRPADSVGMGLAWSWLNPEIFARPSELMFQWYYQAKLVGNTFFQPTLTYIPTPGASPTLGGAWAVTFRVTVLF